MQKQEKYQIKGQEDGEFSFSLIAQEVLEILPEVVSETDEDDFYMGLSYTELIPVLISCMQEQQAIIQTLTEEVADINDVRKEMDQLRAELAAFKNIKATAPKEGDEQSLSVINSFILESGTAAKASA